MSKVAWLDYRPDENPHFRVDLCWTETFYVNRWYTTIDLTEMCLAAGKKVKDYDVDRGCQYYRIDLPIPQFRKALKLIRRYGDPDTTDQVQDYLDKHFPKWGKEFRDVARKR